MSCLPKPVLRGHIKKKGLQALIGAMTFATVNICLFNFLYRIPKLNRMEEFKKNYDAEAHSRDLIEWGYFQTVRPEDLKRGE